MSTSRAGSIVLAGALLFAACARAAPTREAPMDSVALQARATEETRRFAAKVAAEPPSERLAVERVARAILIAPKEHVLYLLDPDLVAIDAITGAERWRATDVRGDELGRAGRYLVATTVPVPPPASPNGPGAARATVAWIDPSAPTKPGICSVTPPAPRAADEIELVPFDRAGALYLHWRSSLHSWHGGTHPPPERGERANAAEGCGVLAFDVGTCGTRPAEVPGYDRSACSPNSPTIVIPAVAASAAPIYTQANPGFHIDEQRADKDGCEQRTTRVLRATDGDRVLWSRKLTDIVSICGPP